jgi:photosystem II stability/assembly factor-like uncharacterized protein
MRSIPRLETPIAAAWLAVATAVLCVALAGCGDDDTPNGPAPIYSSIVITGPDTVALGGSAGFGAVVLDTAGVPVASPQLTWSSSAPAIASVNNAGVVTGVSEGDVTILAAGGGVTSNVVATNVFPGFGWFNQSSGAFTIADLHGVWFADARNGWAVGDLGTILRTIDAGRTWTVQNSYSTGYTLNAVAFATSSTGIVVGSAGRVLRTVNAGVTWTQLTISSGGSGLNHVYFQDAQRGWIVGNGGVVLRTTNAGASWTRVQPSVTIADLERVSFPRYTLGGTPPTDPYGHGWAVGSGGTIIGSDDFGATWKLFAPFATTDPLLGVARRSLVDAIAVGQNNRALMTIADADSALWQLAAAPNPFTNLTAVSWSPQSPLPGSAWAVGKRPDLAIPVVLYSADGGVTWSEQLLPGTAPLDGNGLDDVFFINDAKGWAVGSQGLILHTVTGGFDTP